MQFDNTQPIWAQIYELLLTHIADGEWCEEERVASVRELGATLAVNPNTVMRAYERATDEQLIYNRRGIGYFVSVGARERAATLLRQRFEREQLPSIFRSMQRVGITAEEFVSLYKNYQENENKQ
ncbi:MAG: GntR family transcriptional regulator [Rikenellaceae bacterium]|nr:GntR family transcriptional regulator [Rikenellaceae bacterium]MBQ3255693.1 GntR family transcriptional regulator [Rikenellaceae bacterium]MBQ5679574.1 GntR family transcriptional regulator [Rikenellaceae bacterium]MBR2049472.1 GntR family transcriptional regulator [Rikenellaceae bacterium]MBR2501203.1 GntR family transcriptional regulator [Rikenellaceae bacterium]